MNWRYRLVKPHLVNGLPTSSSWAKELPNSTSILLMFWLKEMSTEGSERDEQDFESKNRV